MDHDDAPDEHAGGPRRPWHMSGDPAVDAADAPTTGDAAIDAVVRELVLAHGGPLEGQIAAGEKAHRVLQARLSDLGGE